MVKAVGQMMHLPRALTVIAFVSGFVLLSFELIIARLMAPTLGSSTYMWTSVIGTVIAALAVGYYVGGKLADRRELRSDVSVIMLIAAVAIMWTLVAHANVLALVAETGGDARLQGIFAALILAVPASFTLGVLGPYLAKLRVTSLASTGSSVASLDAANSIGGIIGTFATGFILFGALGSRESIFVLIGMLLAASWLIAPKEKIVMRVSVTAAILVMTIIFIVPNNRNGLSIDTPTAHYDVIEATYGHTPARLLATGPRAWQSGVALSNPDDLLFWYTSRLARVVAEVPQKANVLVLGGGAFTLPSYIAKHYPDSKVTVVEIDPSLPDVSRRYFGLSEHSNLSIIATDARSYISTTDAIFDVVIVDVYNGTSIPFALLTKEYVSELKRVTKPAGIVAVNTIGAFAGRCAPITNTINSLYQSQFTRAVYDRHSTNVSSLANIIMVFSDSDFPLTGFRRLPHPMVTSLPSDNLSRTEELQAACVGA